MIGWLGSRMVGWSDDQGARAVCVSPGTKSGQKSQSWERPRMTSGSWFSSVVKTH